MESAGSTGRMKRLFRRMAIVVVGGSLSLGAAASAQESLVRLAPSIEVPAAEIVPAHDSSGDAAARFSPWWADRITAPLQGGDGHLGITLEGVLVGALRHSPQVRVYADSPVIRESAIAEACANFDWLSFIETRWDDTSEPVGNALTTGGPSRFRDHVWSGTAGLRRRNQIGGQFEIGQRFGFQNNNSVFFVPNDQGTARLTIGYTQPLLRGAGRVYNTSLVVLAQLDASAAYDELSRQLQAHLMDVATAYWGLYLQRAVLLQKERFHNSAQEIMVELERREDIDALRSQIISARAAVESRRADVVRARTSVRNGESRIRALVGDPVLVNQPAVEMVPLDIPPAVRLPIDMDYALQAAMSHRPELRETMKQIKGASVRLNLAKNEMLPLLNVVLQTYASGLDGATDIPQAFVNQFNQGEPSYGIGLQYEVPLGRRAAQARCQRRHLEMRQLQSQLGSVTQNIRLEVEVAVREVDTAYQEMEAKYRALEAAAAKVEYIAQRWRLLPGDDRSASLLLEELLDDQVRLNSAEFQFVEAQLTYSLAHMNIRRAMGTLLEYEQVSLGKACACDGPAIILDKPELPLAEWPQAAPGH